MLLSSARLGRVPISHVLCLAVRHQIHVYSSHKKMGLPISLRKTELPVSNDH